MPVPELVFDAAPHRLSEVVYGALLNHRAALEALGATVNDAPYKGAPKAPVLYVKPRNTLAGDGDAVCVPADAGELEVGAALGIVIGRTACNVRAGEALKYVAGYTVVNDVSVPHSSFYRPSVPCKARDGFCPIGPRVVAREAVRDPDALRVRVEIDGVCVHETITGGMIRPVARLLADVTEFMTLSPGDVLMLGVAAGAPRVRAGQRVTVEIEDVGRLSNHFVADERAAA